MTPLLLTKPDYSVGELADLIRIPDWRLRKVLAGLREPLPRNGSRGWRRIPRERVAEVAELAALEIQAGKERGRAAVAVSEADRQAARRWLDELLTSGESARSA